MWGPLEPKPLRCSLKLGLVGLFTYMGLGLLLEFLLFLDAPFYVNDGFLRRLWNLAHAHGTLAWLVYLVYFRVVDEFEMPDALRRAGQISCAAGATLLPLGFLLGAISHGDDRPSWPIGLVPIGGILLATAILLPFFAGREGERNGNQSG